MKSTFLIPCSAMTLFSLMTINAHSAAISLVPTSNVNIGIGDIVSFDLHLDATDLTELLGGGLDVFYDENVLSYNGDFVFDPGLPTDPSFSRTGDDCASLLASGCSSPGEINGIAFGNFVGLPVGSDYLVGTLSFTGIADGTSVLNMQDNDTPAGGFVDFTGAPINPAMQYVAATVTVSAVPVPAAVWLFGSGLLGLAGVARRVRKLK